MNVTTPDSPILFAYALDGDGGGSILDAEAVRRWSADAGILWLHLDAESLDAQQLTNEFGIDPIIAAVLGAGETRPRVSVENTGLMAVLRGVNMNPGAHPEDMVSIRIWLEASRIITSQRRQLMAVRDIRNAIEHRDGPRTPGDFLNRLLEGLAERIGDMVGKIEVKVDELEAEMDAAAAAGGDPPNVVASLRQAAAIRRYLAPQRDALDRLCRDTSTVLSTEEGRVLREQTEQVTHHLENLDLARERGLVLREQYMSLLAQQQNTRLYVLSIVTAFFLPLSFVTGMLGMNLAGQPGTEHPSAFTLAMLSIVVAGIGLAVFFKWKKWM